MEYTPHNLRIGINNAESSLRWLSELDPTTMTEFDHMAITLNMSRIARFQKMLDLTKGFKPKYL